MNVTSTTEKKRELQSTYLSSGQEQMKLAQEVESFVHDILTALPPDRLTPLIPLNREKIGKNVLLKSGTSVPFVEVQEILVRLELMRMVAAHTFIALTRCVSEEPSYLSDPEKISAQIWGCGEVSPYSWRERFSVERVKDALVEVATLMNPLFLLGRYSIRERDERYHSIHQLNRLQFTFHPWVKEVLQDAVKIDGEQITLTSPLKNL